MNNINDENELIPIKRYLLDEVVLLLISTYSLANQEDWDAPESVEDYLARHAFVDRIRERFGDDFFEKAFHIFINISLAVDNYLDGASSHTEPNHEIDTTPK
jgi:hypothetical protein